MLILNQEQSGGESRQVPMAERTAAALERALLAPDRAARELWLAETLADDPALAAWAAHEARRQDQSEAKTAAQAAAWLADRLAEKLSLAFGGSQDADRHVLDRVPPDEAERYAAAYAAILVQAKQQRSERGSTEPLIHDESYFSALVKSIDEVLAAQPPRAHTEERLLPAFPPVTMHTAGSGDSHSSLPFTSHEPGIEWRLPALLAVLGNYERQLADFDRRLEHEKLESLKELAYGASHEINNPLANIAARAQTLLTDETDPERRRKLSAIHRQAMRAHEMIADLMLFARPPKLNLAACDLRHVVRQVVDEIAPVAHERNIEVACDVSAAAVPLTADETQLAVAIQAVLINSIEAIGEGGRVDVAVRPLWPESEGPAPNAPQAWGEVVVADDGPGISEAVRQHIFDPFFSGREAGRGLGFGLSKCWRIVTDHGGQVVVSQSTGRGAQLTILLPLADGTSQTTSPRVNSATTH